MRKLQERTNSRKRRARIISVPVTKSGCESCEQPRRHPIRCDHVAPFVPPTVFTPVRSISCARAIAGAELTNSANERRRRVHLACSGCDARSRLSLHGARMHIYVEETDGGEAVIESTTIGAAIKVSVWMYCCLYVSRSREITSRSLT